MLVRNALDLIKKDLLKSPAVILFGPRQVGKTTLVKQIAAEDTAEYEYLDLELPSDRAKLSDPELFLSRLTQKTVILDEVQYIPELFPILRALIDQDRRPGRFILLGSASPVLLQQSSESLAGRVRYREIFPLTLRETNGIDYEKLWFRGGFPEAYLAESDQEAMEWYGHFVRSYTTRDLSVLGLSMPALQIERLLRMLAHLHGQLLNMSSLSRSLGVSSPSIANALYYLEEAMLIRTLKPWHNNSGKRLIKSPKVYIRDSGMLHYLLGVESLSNLLGHPQAGNSWEGFVIQQIISTQTKNQEPYFYRTAKGAEVDLLLTKGNDVTSVIEIKLSTAPQLTRGNTEAVNDLNPEKKIVVIPGEANYPMKDGWEVMGVRELLKPLDNNNLH